MISRISSSSPAIHIHCRQTSQRTLPPAQGFPTRRPLTYLHTLFQSRLKTYLFYKSFPVVSLLLPDCLHGPGPFIHSYSVFVFSFFLSFLMPCALLSWPSRQLLSARKYTVSFRMLLTQKRKAVESLKCHTFVRVICNLRTFIYLLRTHTQSFLSNSELTIGR